MHLDQESRDRIDGDHQGRQLAVAAAEPIVDTATGSTGSRRRSCCKVAWDGPARLRGKGRSTGSSIGWACPAGRMSSQGCRRCSSRRLRELPDRAYFAAGNAFHPLALANAGGGLGRLPPDMADDGVLVVAAGKLQAVDLHGPAAVGLPLGRIVDDSRTVLPLPLKHQVELVDAQHDARRLLWRMSPSRH